MPLEVMHTSQSVEELFHAKAAERGLDMEKTPYVVRMLLSTLSQAAIGPMLGMLEELPPDARAFDWMGAAFLAYAEWFDHTIVVDTTVKAEPEAPTDGPTVD